LQRSKSLQAKDKYIICCRKFLEIPDLCEYLCICELGTKPLAGFSPVDFNQHPYSSIILSATIWVLFLLVLHVIADAITSGGTTNSTDCRSRARVANTLRKLRERLIAEYRRGKGASG